MLRWLLGWGGNQDQNSNTKKAIQPAQRWRSDGQGGYIKHAGDSTAAAIASFAGEQALAQPRTPVLSAGFSKKGLVEDDSFPADNAPDALSAYQEELVRTAADLQASLAKWMDKKVEVIGGDPALTQYAAQARVHPGADLIAGINAFFKQLFENIKADFVPASTELHHLLDEAHGHVQKLCDHLDVSCQKLDEAGRTAEEKRRVCIDICNDSIQIVNDLIAMINNIEEELDYCLKFEGLTEEAARKLAQLIVLIVLKVPMPELDFNFKSTYRHFLFNEIEGEKKEIELFETDVKGHLAHAMKEIGLQEQVWEKAANDSSSEKPESGVLSGSLFAPTPVSTPVSPRLPEQEVAVTPRV